MCELRALNFYKTSDELMMDLNNCFIRCPSIGALLKTQADCLMFKQALQRHLDLLQKEDKKKKEVALAALVEATEIPEVAKEKEFVLVGATKDGRI